MNIINIKSRRKYKLFSLWNWKPNAFRLIPYSIMVLYSMVHTLYHIDYQYIISKYFMVETEWLINNGIHLYHLNVCIGLNAEGFHFWKRH